MPHINKLIDFTVSAFIVYDNRVLLIFHKKLKKWLPVGGHIELNEDPEEALFREVKEECGLKIIVLGKKPSIKSKGTKFLYSPAFLDIHDIADVHKHIGLCYFAKAKSGKVALNKEEHDDMRWFSEKDLNDPKFRISLAIKFYAKESLSRINNGNKGN